MLCVVGCRPKKRKKTKRPKDLDLTYHIQIQPTSLSPSSLTYAAKSEEEMAPLTRTARDNPRRLKLGPDFRFFWEIEDGLLQYMGIKAEYNRRVGGKF